MRMRSPAYAPMGRSHDVQWLLIDERCERGWSKQWLYESLRLFNGYKVRKAVRKVAPVLEQVEFSL